MTTRENRWNWWTVVIGDVHGCLDELRDLLSRVDEDCPGARLVFLGDLLDRGPDSSGVLRYVRGLAAEREVHFLLGNHEEKHLAFRKREDRRRRDGTPNLMQLSEEQRAVHDTLTSEDFSFMEQMKPFLRFRTNGVEWIATHAGIPSDVPVEDQRVDKLVRTRFVSEDTGRYKAGKTPFDIPEGSVPWFVRWKGPENVVYGHDVHDLKNPRFHQSGKFTCVGIDTGCAFGGCLTAMVIPPDYHPLDNPMYFRQETARRTYAEGRFPKEAVQ